MFLIVCPSSCLTTRGHQVRSALKVQNPKTKARVSHQLSVHSMQWFAVEGILYCFQTVADLRHDEVSLHDCQNSAFVSAAAILAKVDPLLLHVSFREKERCSARAVGYVAWQWQSSLWQGCDGEEITYPECATFSKNGVAPPTDATTCREACVTAEGLAEVNGNLEDWKGTSGAGECSCMQSNGGHRTVCKDASYSAWVATEAQRWRMMTMFSNSRC